MQEIQPYPYPCQNARGNLGLEPRLAPQTTPSRPHRPFSSSRMRLWMPWRLKRMRNHRFLPEPMGEGGIQRAAGGGTVTAEPARRRKKRGTPPATTHPVINLLLLTDPRFTRFQVSWLRRWRETEAPPLVTRPWPVLAHHPSSHQFQST